MLDDETFNRVLEAERLSAMRLLPVTFNRVLEAERLSAMRLLPVTSNYPFRRNKMVATTVKVVNYTPEQTAELRTAYLAAPGKATVEAMATKMGKTTKSIVAKLVREGVYVKPGKVSKDGLPVVRKNDLVEKIAAEIGITSDKLDGLEAAPKNALKLILWALAFDDEPEAVDTDGMIEV